MSHSQFSWIYAVFSQDCMITNNFNLESECE